jgi:hypothetical protein
VPLVTKPELARRMLTRALEAGVAWNRRDRARQVWQAVAIGRSCSQHRSATERRSLQDGLGIADPLPTRDAVTKSDGPVWTQEPGVRPRTSSVEYTTRSGWENWM